MLEARNDYWGDGPNVDTIEFHDLGDDASAALGALLQARGYTVRLRKLAPYLNVDPGTMSPYEHGEVFVTDDGAETDLDLGHYERFTGVAARATDSRTCPRRTPRRA